MEIDSGSRTGGKAAAEADCKTGWKEKRLVVSSLCVLVRSSMVHFKAAFSPFSASRLRISLSLPLPTVILDEKRSQDSRSNSAFDRLSNKR